MAVKLSDLTTESAPASTDILLIADPTTGLAKKITVSALKTYMDGLGGGGDATAPVVVSATASTASTIVIVFSESVTVTTAGWSFKKNGVSWAISSVTGSGNTWTFTMATSGISSDTILRSYDSATGATVDTAANELASFTDSAVTNSIPASSYEAESDLFFAANTGLTTGQKDAIDDLVVSMKSIGWSKFKAVYPFVGGTAAAHKWNLVNPVDTNGGYRLTFNGSFTHDTGGITGGGTVSDYAETYFNPSTGFTGNSGFLGVYVRSGWSDGETVMGTYISGKATQMAYAAGNAFWCMGQDVGTIGALTANPAAYTKFLCVSRTGATAADGDAYRDGTDFADEGAAFNAYTNGNIYISARNAAGADTPSNANIALAVIADGLTPSEISTLTTAVNAYQTALGRNV